MSQGYDRKKSPLQASISDRLNFIRKMARATATAHIILSLPGGAKNRHNPNLPYDIMKTLTGRSRRGDVTEASR